MMGNGVLRILVLQPVLGEDLARQAACLSGIFIILGLTRVLVPRLHARDARQLLAAGSIWLGLTVAFEFLFGHYGAGMEWKALAAEYNLLRGRLWPLVLLTTFLAPWLCRHSGRGAAEARP